MNVCDFKGCDRPLHAKGLCKGHYNQQWFADKRPRRTNDWTPDRVAIIASLLHEGLSASQIGARLGVSRNCIIGKVHRFPALKAIGFARKAGSLDGVPRIKKSRIPGVLAKPKPSKPKPIKFNFGKVVFDSKPVPPPVPKVIECRSVSLMELNANECRWPVNDSATRDGHLFCGNPSSGPYCPGHAYLSVGRGTESERRATHWARGFIVAIEKRQAA